MAGSSFNPKREIIGIFFIAAAIVFSVAYFFGKLGVFGIFLRNIGFGLFGVTAYIIPVILLYMAFDYFFERQSKITNRRFLYVTVLVIAVSALIHVFSVSYSDFIKIVNPNGVGNAKASESLVMLWNIGIEGFGEGNDHTIFTGGLLGGLIAFSLSSITDKAGTVIIVSAIIISEIVLLFNVSFSGAIKNTKVKIDDAVREKAKSFNQKPKAVSKDFDIVLEDKNKKVKSGLFGLPGFLRDDDEKNKIESDPDKKIEEDDGLLEIILQENESQRDNDKDFLDVITDPNIDLPAGIKRVDKTEPSNKITGAGDGKEDYSVRKIVIPGQGNASSQENVEKTHLNGNSDNSNHKAVTASTERPFVLPSVELLNTETPLGEKNDLFTIQALGKKLENTLNNFGISAKVVNITNGPIITRFELTPGPGVKVSKIVSLADDIALNLAATGVRIEAPIPGKSAIGIEVPNKKITPVALRRLIESSDFKNTSAALSCVLGRDIPGNPVVCDISKMPHLLIAGATGSGKSVCINSILISILYKAKPDEVKMLMIDPKVVELSIYNGIPHLLAPVVTNPKKASNSLNWAVSEMTKRYALFAEQSVREIQGYNSRARTEGYEKLPLILIVIDELSDLMATSPREVEDAIARLTAMARAAGIHLIIATQRPSVDVITGVIKANIPSRIAFAVSSQVDSRTILDGAGAEKLLGKGDMLYFPIGASKAIRAQGAYVTEQEVERVTTFLKNQNTSGYDDETTNAIVTASSSVISSESNEDEKSSEDEILTDAVTIVVEAGYASISLLQRRMNIGYPRAARLIDRMNEKGYVGAFEGSKPRKVLITPAQWAEYRAKEGV